MIADDRVAVVTGGTRGIGRAVVERFLRGGLSVVAAARSVTDGRRLLDDLAEDHLERLSFVPCDVASRRDVEMLFEHTIDRHGRVDVAVVNAGIERAEAFLSITDAQWSDVIATNLTGAFLTTQIAARRMGAGGRIVLIASTNAFSVETNLGSYNSSKAGMIGLMKSAAVELAASGITVNAVGPGLVLTDMTRSLADDPEASREYLRHIPTGRFGQPEDVAAAVGFLASRESGWITGHHLVVDGGQTIGLPVSLDAIGAEHRSDSQRKII